MISSRSDRAINYSRGCDSWRIMFVLPVDVADQKYKIGLGTMSGLLDRLHPTVKVFFCFGNKYFVLKQISSDKIKNSWLEKLL